MPRYTDIDLLIDKIEGTTWYHINKNGELVVGANSKTDTPLYKHSDIKRVLTEASVVDVVPKSDVEKIADVAQKNIDSANERAEMLRKESEKLRVLYENARQEVAREIFEEIEKFIQDRKNEELKRQGDNKMISPFTYSFGALEIIEFQIAELRKKYVEGATDG